MGIVTGIHDGNLIIGISVAAVMLIVLLPLILFSIRFAERATPGDALRIVKIVIIVGVALTFIASIIGTIIHHKEEKSNQAVDNISKGSNTSL